MIIKTIVPKLGEAIYYIGEPVMNGCGARIGGIIDVEEVDDHYELTMSLKGVYSKPDRDLESFLAVNKSKNKSKTCEGCMFDGEECTTLDICLKDEKGYYTGYKKNK